MAVFDDEFFMRKAIIEGRDSTNQNEVPVGALIVAKNKIIGRGSNQVERLNDVTAHAEMIAITAAQHHIRSKYLSDCTAYITLEPCTMCAGAFYWCRIGRIVIGTKDFTRGFNRHGTQVLHPKTQITWNILPKQCKNLMKDFFSEIRKNK